MIDSQIKKYLFLKDIISENIINLSLAVEALRFLKGTKNDSDQVTDDIILDIETLGKCESEFLDEYLLLSDAIKSKCDAFLLNSSSDQMDIDRAARYSYVKRYLMKPRDLNNFNE